MPASLNIKNPETHRLAEELAKLTGESMAAAVQNALRERLEQLKTEQSRAARLERMVAIAKDCAAHLSDEVKAMDFDAEFYDDRGLPK